jgi:hypothetical protein
LANWDNQALLKAIGLEYWNDVFKPALQQQDRSYTTELLSVRNRSAHDETFSNDDAYRALDTAQRLTDRAKYVHQDGNRSRIDRL